MKIPFSKVAPSSVGNFRKNSKWIEEKHQNNTNPIEADDDKVFNENFRTKNWALK